MTKTQSANRRIWRGVRNDTPIMMMRAGNRYSTCRLTKKKASSPRRTATGGLAASERIMPASINVIRASSIRRSTVHHHAANGVRSVRDTIGDLPESGRTLKSCLQGGFQEINAVAQVLPRGTRETKRAANWPSPQLIAWQLLQNS